MPTVSRDSSRGAEDVAGGLQRLGHDRRALDRPDGQVDGDGVAQHPGEIAVGAVRGGRGDSVRHQPGTGPLTALGHAVVAQHLVGQRDRVPADRERRRQGALRRQPDPGRELAGIGEPADPRRQQAIERAVGGGPPAEQVGQRVRADQGHFRVDWHCHDRSNIAMVATMLSLLIALAVGAVAFAGLFWYAREGFRNGDRPDDAPVRAALRSSGQPGEKRPVAVVAVRNPGGTPVLAAVAVRRALLPGWLAGAVGSARSAPHRPPRLPAGRLPDGRGGARAASTRSCPPRCPRPRAVTWSRSWSARPAAGCGCTGCGSRPPRSTADGAATGPPTCSG